MNLSLPYHKITEVGSYGALSETTGWNVSDLKVPNAWAQTRGAGVTAMVIDTGFSDHMDLKGNEIQGPSFVAGEPNIDLNGHGSHCAGIIAACQNNEGVVGVAPEAQVISVKALSNNGMSNSKVIKASLEYALKIKPDIINLSLGSRAPMPPDTLELLQELYRQNIPLVCAAGNNGVIGGVQYPAKYNEAIAVGAYDKNGKLATFSAIGPEVDFIAPGVEILSTFKENEYAVISGTSMAAPVMTGMLCLIISLIKKHHPAHQISVSDIRMMLTRFCNEQIPDQHGLSINSWKTVPDEEIRLLKARVPEAAKIISKPSILTKFIRLFRR